MMNSPHDDPDRISSSRQDAMQAEAIEDVRRRVSERERREAAEAQLEAARRPRRAFWEFAPDSQRGFLYDLFGARLMLWIGLSALWLVISSVLWLLTNLRLPVFLLLRALDTATGAQALRGAPWLMWTLWGAVFGGSLGYWLVAPLYGQRENRALLLLGPLLAMALSSALLWAFIR